MLFLGGRGCALKITRYGLALIFAIAVLAIPSKADTVTLLVSGSFDAGAFSFAPGSTMTFDTTTSTITASSFSITGLGDVWPSVPNFINTSFSEFWIGSLGDELNLAWSVGSDGSVVPGHFDFQVNGGGSFDINPFTLTSITTPEPSSLLLLGTGFLGLMRMRRKRLA